MEMWEIMKQRHSVRQYTEQPIAQETRLILNAMAEEINRDTGLHIQVLYDEPTCFKSPLAHYGKFSGVCNYMALVGKRSLKPDEMLGYYGEKMVLKAQELGLNTCWVALTHGKSKADIRKGEKAVCLIALGYGATAGTEHSSKPLQAVCKCVEPMPTWFADGVTAALLAPTAMNQQKFCFELLPDGTVKATAGSGFYTKLDLGIVKYHFEAVSGKTVG